MSPYLGTSQQMRTGGGTTMNAVHYNEIHDITPIHSPLHFQSLDVYSSRGQGEQEMLNSSSTTPNGLPQYGLAVPSNLNNFAHQANWSPSSDCTDPRNFLRGSYPESPSRTDRGGDFDTDAFDPSRFDSEIKHDIFSHNSNNTILLGFETNVYNDDAARLVPGHYFSGQSDNMTPYSSCESTQPFSRNHTLSQSPLEIKHENDDPYGNDFGPPFLSISSGGTSDEDHGFSSREQTYNTNDERVAEAPYARLIQSALLSAPHFAMTLQEIYQWFRDHTNKGRSNGKGWMNSVRHNLSMNGAFQKTERSRQPDETKKPAYWVLTEDARKNGVCSTTRYRKGCGAKKNLRHDRTTASSRQVTARKNSKINISPPRGMGTRCYVETPRRDNLRIRPLAYATDRLTRLVEDDKSASHRMDVHMAPRQRSSPVNPSAVVSPDFFEHMGTGILQGPFGTQNLGLEDVKDSAGPMFCGGRGHGQEHAQLHNGTGTPYSIQRFG